MLHGRGAPIASIDALLTGAREHRSGALLLHGEAGIGKSALLDYARSQAGGMTIVQGAGFQSESSFSFAVLGQIVGPLTDLIDRLPDPQATSPPKRPGTSGRAGV